MTRPAMALPLALAALTLLAAGCTLGPDPEQAPATAADAAQWAEAPTTGEEAPELPPDDWWRSFADPVTVELVETALANNTDVRVAAARVLEAEAALRSARGTLYPSVDYGLTGQRNKFSFVLPQVGRVGIYSTTFQQNLSVSYQVDLFGRLKRTRQAAWANLVGAEADRKTVVNSLIAQVIRTRAAIAAMERQLAIDRQTLESWSTTEDIVEARYRAGVVDAGELYLVRESRARAAAAIPQLERSLAAAYHALDVMLGRQPGTGPKLPETLPDVPALDPVPVGLPASLLDRRPDLVASRMQFSAATALVGVALANLYPNLTLTGSAGIVSDDVANLVNTDGLIYNVLAGLVAPIFHGGQLRAEVDAARARAEAAASRYAGAVLNALREVEDALAAEKALRDQLEWTRQQLEAARGGESLARWRYDIGTGAILDLLTADRALRNSELALTITQANLWDVRVGLYLALGGDWESAAAPPPAEDGTAEAPSSDATPAPAGPRG